MPPSNAALTVAFFSSWPITGKAEPIKPPPPENSIIPNPIGVTTIFVFPRIRFEIDCSANIDLSLSRIVKMRKIDHKILYATQPHLRRQKIRDNGSNSPIAELSFLRSNQ